jgi:hypothetical protein
MAKKKAQTRAEAARELLGGLSQVERPAEQQSNVYQAKPSEAKAHHEMASGQTPVGEPSSRPDERPGQQTPAVVPVSNTFDAAGAPAARSPGAAPIKTPEESELQQAGNVEAQEPRRQEQQQAEAVPTAEGPAPGAESPVEALESAAQTIISGASPVKNSLLDAPTPSAVAVLTPRQRRAKEICTTVRRNNDETALLVRELIEDRLYVDLGYATVEQCVRAEFGRTKQWAYDQLRWARTLDWLAAAGIEETTLSRDAGQMLGAETPEVAVIAYQRVVADGERPTRERLESKVPPPGSTSARCIPGVRT